MWRLKPTTVILAGQSQVLELGGLVSQPGKLWTEDIDKMLLSLKILTKELTFLLIKIIISTNSLVTPKKYVSVNTARLL